MALRILLQLRLAGQLVFRLCRMTSRKLTICKVRSLASASNVVLRLIGYRDWFREPGRPEHLGINRRSSAESSTPGASIRCHLSYSRYITLGRRGRALAILVPTTCPTRPFRTGMTGKLIESVFPVIELPHYVSAVPPLPLRGVGRLQRHARGIGFSRTGTPAPCTPDCVPYLMRPHARRGRSAPPRTLDPGGSSSWLRWLAGIPGNFRLQLRRAGDS